MGQLNPFTITIVGPESSGKTTLASQLAAFYGCTWVPEFAREYLEGLERPYTLVDLHRIAEGQWERIQLAVGSPQPAIDGPLTAVGTENWANRMVPFQRESFGEEPRSIVIIDSGMLSLRMWARIKYGATIPLVEEVLGQDITSMYLLLRPVLEWEPDPLREAPALLERAWIYNQYLSELGSWHAVPVPLPAR